MQRAARSFVDRSAGGATEPHVETSGLHGRGRLGHAGAESHHGFYDRGRGAHGDPMTVFACARERAPLVQVPMRLSILVARLK